MSDLLTRLARQQAEAALERDRWWHTYWVDRVVELQRLNPHLVIQGADAEEIRATWEREPIAPGIVRLRDAERKDAGGESAAPSGVPEQERRSEEVGAGEGSGVPQALVLLDRATKQRTVATMLPILWQVIRLLKA